MLTCSRSQRWAKCICRSEAQLLLPPQLQKLLFHFLFQNGRSQRWSPRGRPWPRGRPRGHILKSLALALASKPQVLGLGLGLEPLGPRKLPFPRLEDSIIFEPLKFCRKTPETSRKICKYLFYSA